MPALIKTDYIGEVVWLGFVASRQGSLRSAPLTEMPLTYGGYEAEDHAGVTRPSCSRVLTQYPRDTEIRNVRQLSIVSGEELDTIARKIGMDALDPTLLGTSMVIRGIPDFTHIPPSARLQFADGTTLTVDMENRPCIFPAQEIEAEQSGAGKAFKPAAQGMRGVTAWVEREGIIRVGDAVTLHIPDQPQWAP